MSVVVPVLNGAGTLAPLLHALANQAGVPAGTELIVVDNGSTDGSASVAERSGVTVLWETTPGPSAARNLGLRHARGPIVAHIDADALPSRRWLAGLLAAFADPDVVLAGGRVESYPPASGPERYAVAAGTFDTAFAARRPVLPFVPGLTLAVRRDAAVAAGGWAEDMRGGEDVDFCTRVLRATGGRIAYCPDAVLFHRNRSTDAALREQARVWGAGMADLYRRYPDAVQWTWRSRVEAAGRLLDRGARPARLRLARRLGRATAEEVEFARYHRLWTWSYWAGFRARYRETRP